MIHGSNLDIRIHCAGYLFWIYFRIGLINFKKFFKIRLIAYDFTVGDNLLVTEFKKMLAKSIFSIGITV